jgi:hypothetical protein
MTISEAIDLLTPLAKRLNCSICIEPPQVWIWDHREWKVEAEAWKIHLCENNGAYRAPTLDAAVRMALDAHREEPIPFAEVQAAIDEIEALAVAS